jgi:transcriptional regulator of arginine metabolism
MPKQTRQEIIKTILNANIVETQEQLVDLLSQAGVEVTQATVSRDIKDMALIKVPIRAGRYRYSMPVVQPNGGEGKMERVMADALQAVKYQDKFVSLELTPGSGPAVASILQSRDDERIFTLVPTDASILLICRSDEDARNLAGELDLIVG